MTIYVLEGPDGAGKTTLAGLIETRRRLRGRPVYHLHNGPPPPEVDMLTHYLNQIRGVLASADIESSDFIFDRLHVGEIVYGPIVRGKSRLTDVEAHAIDVFLDSVGAVKIYVTAPLGVLEHRLEDRGDDLISVNQLRPLLAGYEEYMGRASAKSWIRWDTTKQGRVFA